MRGMNEMMRQAQIMQKKMTALQDELKQREVEASAGGGMVTVRCSGGKEIKAVTIDPSVMEDGDLEMLQDMILAAANDALKKAGELVESEMAKITGGFQMPGMFA